MRELMRHYQQQLQDEDLAASDAIVHQLKHPSGNTFVGVEKCAGCHTKAHAQWKDTGHAAAFTTLKEGPWSHSFRARREKSIGFRDNSIRNVCHATSPAGTRKRCCDMAVATSAKRPIQNICSDSNAKTVTDPAVLTSLKRKTRTSRWRKLLAERRKMKRTLEEAKKSMCVECHDPDNSPKFTPERFNEFWEQVKHPGKD